MRESGPRESDREVANDMSNHSVVNPGGVRVDRGAARTARRGWSLWLLIAVWIGASSAMAAEVVQVRVGKHADFTRVVFELDRAAGYRIERKDTGSGPGELIVSLQAGSPARKIRSKKSLISEVKVEPAGTKSTARIQLRQANLPLKEMILTNPPRIVLDILADGRGASKVAAAAKRSAAKSTAAAASAAKSAANTAKSAAASSKSKASAALADAGKTADAGANSVIEQAKAARAAAAARLDKTKAAAAEKAASAKAASEAATEAASKTAKATGKAAGTAAENVAEATRKAAEKTKNAAKDAAGAAKTAAANAADSAAETAASAKAKLADNMGEMGKAGNAAATDVKAKAQAAKTAAANAAKNAATPPDSKSPMVVQTRKAAQKQNDGGWMNWALMGAGALLLVGGGAFVASRRRGETVDFFDEEEGSEEDAEAIGDVNPFAGLDENDDAPAMRDAAQGEADPVADTELGESAGFALGADANLVDAETDAGDLAGQNDDEKEQESVFETGSAESDMDVISRDAVNESLGMPPTMGGVPDELMQLVRDMQAKVEGLEGRVEELVDARDRLERQVAAQTEELRVQRAAIARTQRAVRNLARPEDDEQEPTEPALRDPNKND